MLYEVITAAAPKTPAAPGAPRPVEQNRFAERLRAGERMFLVELDPPKHLDAGPALAAAEALAAGGADAITVAENPLASPRLSSIALAAMIRARTGSEVIVHMTGRDRNLIGMQSSIMGLAAQGLLNVLAVTGDPPPAGGEDKVSGVFDVRSFELMELIRSYNFV